MPPNSFTGTGGEDLFFNITWPFPLDDFGFERPLFGQEICNGAGGGICGGGVNRLIDTAVSTVSAVPIPFEFEASLGLFALGGMFGGYTLIKKRKQQKSLA